MLPASVVKDTSLSRRLEDVPGEVRGDCQGSGGVPAGFFGVFGAERVAAVQGRLREVAGQVD